jgi:uncharacterized protein YecT (DUF1311 family)
MGEKIKSSLIAGAFVILFVAASTFAVSGYAQGQPEKTDCWQTAQTQSDLNQCAGSHYHETRQKLELIHDAILKAYADDPAFVKAFKASRKAWLAYRDAMGTARFPHAEEPGYYGTVLPMCETQYRESLAQVRIKQLRPWLEGTQEGEVCAGSLKLAPVGTSAAETVRAAQSASASSACHQASHD